MEKGEREIDEMNFRDELWEYLWISPESKAYLKEFYQDCIIGACTGTFAFIVMIALCAIL